MSSVVERAPRRVHRMRWALAAASVAAVALAVSPQAASGAGVLVSDKADTAFPTANGRVRTMLQVGTNVFVGGQFTSIGGQNRVSLAQLTTAGAVTSFIDDLDGAGSVESLAVSPDGLTLYVGGKFSSIGGQKRRNLAAIDVATGAVLPFNPGPAFKVKGVAVSSTRVYAAGTSVKSYQLTGAEDLAFSVTLSPPDFFPERMGAIGIYYVNGQLFLGGYYGAINGVARKNLAAIDPATGNITGWRGRSTCPPMGWSMSADGKTLYLACAGGGGHGNRAVAIDLASGITKWESDGDGNVQGVAEVNGVLYAGGHFTEQLGVMQPRLMAFDAATGAILTWYPQGRVNSALGVWSVLSVNGSLWIGGDFTKPASHLARFNP